MALSQEQIESAINALPIQGRIMLRLVLVQYMDPTQEEIEYIAADRPDPRLQAGTKVAKPFVSGEAIAAIAERVDQYRSRLRRRRERAWLQCECLRKQIIRTELLCTVAERLLGSRFDLDPDAVRELKAHARTTQSKPAIRELEARWDRNEITEEEYRSRRLSVEYQTQLRRLERLRRRLELAKREHQAASFIPLQDHEIAHIWGLPASTLAARKVKYLPQYLQGLQIALDRAVPAGQVTGHLDLWKATFETLSQRPIERSVASYDGLEGSESALIEKLTALASGTLPEEAENRFWLSLTQEFVHAGEYGSKLRSVFGLQRLISILNDMDGSPEALEEELLSLVAPSSKTTAGPLEEPKPSNVQLGEMGEHVLRSLIGEDRT